MAKNGKNGTPRWVLIGTSIAIALVAMGVLGIGLYSTVASFGGACLGTPIITVLGTFCYNETFVHSLNSSLSYERNFCSEPAQHVFSPCPGLIPKPNSPSCDDPHPQWMTTSIYLGPVPRICLQTNSTNLFNPLTNPPQCSNAVLSAELEQRIPFCSLVQKDMEMITTSEKVVTYTYKLLSVYPLCTPDGSICV